MIKHESALNLFERLNTKDENRCEWMIDRLNRYQAILFPRGSSNRSEVIELLTNNRMMTKRFLHGFISDSIDYMNYRNELLNLPFKSEQLISNSPQANKDSVESDVPTLQMKFNYDQSIIFLYIDTEYKTCPFRSEFLQWYDCETSAELIGTLLRLEQSCLIAQPNQRYILIIDSTTQVPINDYFKTTTLTDVMSIEENKLLTIQCHTLLCHLVVKYKLSCLLVEHLDGDIPIFDTIIGKRDERAIKRNSKNKEIHLPFSEFAFGRLINSEHYLNNQFEYRQVRDADMINFQDESKCLSLLTSLLDENIP